MSEIVARAERERRGSKRFRYDCQKVTFFTAYKTTPSFAISQRLDLNVSTRVLLASVSLDSEKLLECRIIVRPASHYMMILADGVEHLVQAADRVGFSNMVNLLGNT